MCTVSLSPSIPDIPSPPPPPKAPAAPPNYQDRSVQSAGELEKRRQIASNKNRILTSTSGLESEANTGKAVLGA